MRARTLPAKCTLRASGHVFLAVPLILGACLIFAPQRSAPADDPPANEPPVIDGFYAEEGPADVWLIYGHVSDPDDSVEDLLVVFGGVFDEYGLTAVVDSNGDFNTGGILPGLQSGTATADTEDIHGAPADTASINITVTP